MVKRIAAGKALGHVQKILWFPGKTFFPPA
jgi:hypothetical protein